MKTGLRLFSTVFTTIFLAELGDKTQLATLLFAADSRNSRLTVFLASSAALVVASVVGVAAGSLLAHRIPTRTLSWLAGTGFILIGLWTLVRA
ncbi:MAG: TMEM165/GDT1 family protein [Acidobacteriota bacterium]